MLSSIHHVRCRIQARPTTFSSYHDHFGNSTLLLPGVDRSPVCPQPKRYHHYANEHTHHCHRYRNTQHLYPHRQPDAQYHNASEFHAHHHVDSDNLEHALPAIHIYCYGDFNLYQHTHLHAIIYANIHIYAHSYVHTFDHEHTLPPAHGHLYIYPLKHTYQPDIDWHTDVHSDLVHESLTS